MNAFVEIFLDLMCLLGSHSFVYGEKIFEGKDSFGREYQVPFPSRKCKHCGEEQVLKGFVFDSTLEWKTIKN